MKKIFSFLLVLIVASVAFAQESEKTLFERVSKIEKKQDYFNLYLNMHGAFDTKFNYDGVNGFNQGAFYMRQFRIEATGRVNDWLWYRWLYRI